MNFEFGDIYLTNFDPSVGREDKKMRPALIIQEEKSSENSPYITILPLSSKIQKFVPPDVYVQKDSKNNLQQDSVIRVRHISTFNKSRLVHYIGKANSPVIRQVRGYLRRHFGL